MTLAALQSRFHARVVEGDGPLAEVAERSQRGLRVYAHAYRATLLACLRDTFEATHAWLGDAGFDAAARAYVAATPSRSWTLSAYGDGFPSRLGALHPNDPEVEELAWLDLRLRRAFDGPDAEPLAPAALAGVDWEEARLLLHPTLAVRPLATNAPAIWSAIAAGETPPPAEALAAPAALRAWRQGLTPTFRAVPAAELAAVEAARAGLPFGRICDALARDADPAAAAAFAGAMLGAWLEDGVLVGVA